MCHGSSTITWPWPTWHTYKTGCVGLGWHKCDITHFNSLNIKYNIHIEISSLHPKSNAYTSSLQLTFKITYVGPEIWGPSPLYIQGPKPRPKSPIAEDVWWKPHKGPRMWPRMISRSTPHKTPEEKDKLSTGAGQGRKLPTP